MVPEYSGDQVRGKSLGGLSALRSVGELVVLLAEDC